MKKFNVFILVLFFTASCSLCGQTVLCDSTKVYDTISDTDSCYLFTHPKPCFIHTACKRFMGRQVLQEYITNQSVTVYGVAVTMVNTCSEYPISDNNPYIMAKLMCCIGPSPLTSLSGYYSMQKVDTVSFSRSHPRFCWFWYNDEKCNTDSIQNNPCINDSSACPEFVPCYEMYFDTPQQINVMTDTFYVGIELPFNTPYFHPWYYGGRYSGTLPSHLYFSNGQYVDFGDGTGIEMGDNYIYHFDQCAGETRVWGIAFPIIGFRCGVMKNYWLEEYGGHYAIVKWRSTEPGTVFHVRLVGEDGSDTTIVTQDTSYVFNWLSDSVRYNVKLRKQCHYCTSNYDTTVYSSWADTIHFGTTILPPQVIRTVTVGSNNPAWGYVYGGGEYLDSSTVTLVAAEFNDNRFYQWNDSVTDNPRQILVVSDTSFTAFFRRIVDTTGGGVDTIVGGDTIVDVDTIVGGDTIIGGDTVGVVQPVAEGFELRPNPARGMVQIVLPPAAVGGCLSLHDMEGREVDACTVTGAIVEWDVSRLPSGAYLVKLTTRRGTTVKKMVIRD